MIPGSPMPCERYIAFDLPPGYCLGMTGSWFVTKQARRRDRLMSQVL